MKRTLFCLFLLLSVGGYRPVCAQTQLTAMQAYEYLQGERARVRSVVGEADKPPTDSLRKGVQILQEALVYYNRPDVVALTKNSKALFFRRSDILYDLARIQSRLGEQTAAVTSVQQIMAPELEGVYTEWILNDPYLTAARQDPSIKPVLDKATALNNVFSSKALATPYQPNLSDDEKLAGLSKLWSEAKYNFAYFDKIPDVNWDKLYLEYIPKMRATRSTAEYLRVLQSFYAQLRDGHTDVWANDPALADSVARRPPIRAMLVEDKVLISEVQSDSLERTGIRPMLELVSIDGVPVKQYADQYVRPYQSGSTPQNVAVGTYTYNLLRGPKNKPVTLTFRDSAGKTFSRTLPRTGYVNLKPMPDFRFRILPGNVAYVQLNSFDNDRAQNGFKAAFDSLAPTNALILDVRRNGGGDSGQGWNILGYLTDKPMKTGSYSSRVYSPLRRARGESVVFEPVETDDSGWPANGKKLYTKPVVVLTSGQTFSAAEDFAVVFDAMKRGTIIGEPTGGSTGQPLSFALPGGVMARVCTKRDRYPDGTEWVGKGVQPNVLVKPTVADLQAGRDPVLDAALRHLNPAGSRSAEPTGLTPKKQANTGRLKAAR